MQRNDRWPEDYDPDGTKSRPTSRRNSASLSRRSSAKKEKEVKKKSPLNSTPNSASSTPKKVVKPQHLEFVVTGKQCLKKCDRANSLPGFNRRPAAETKIKKFDSPKKIANASQSSKSRETSLEDDMSLDLSQVSDFEDTQSKYGIKAKFPLATSTPKVQKTKPRSGSLQTHSKEMRKKTEREYTISCSKDSVFKSSSASPYGTARYGLNNTELDYSSVSPEYSGQSSAELSPRVGGEVATPRSLEPNLSSCCGSSWQDCSLEHTAVEHSGEWSDFWANYNSSTSRVPMKSYYDQCPTPYRTENIDLADLEFSVDGSRKRSPNDIDNINHVIRNEGLHLTPRETQNMIKCAHILGNVLTKAIERRCREKDEVEERIQEMQTETEDPELETKKKTLTLDLKETNEPATVEEVKMSETVTTQTDISLPNTKSAPRIFEKILRQLSKSSLDEGIKAMQLSQSEKDGKEGKDLKIEVKKEN